MHQFVNKEVEVLTPETLYRGVLIEIGEASVQLQSDLGWLEIQMDHILEIRLPESAS